MALRNHRQCQSSLPPSWDLITFVAERKRGFESRSPHAPTPRSLASSEPRGITLSVHLSWKVAGDREDAETIGADFVNSSELPCILPPALPSCCRPWNCEPEAEDPHPAHPGPAGHSPLLGNPPHASPRLAAKEPKTPTLVMTKGWLKSMPPESLKPQGAGPGRTTFWGMVLLAWWPWLPGTGAQRGVALPAASVPEQDSHSAPQKVPSPRLRPGSFIPAPE